MLINQSQIYFERTERVDSITSSSYELTGASSGPASALLVWCEMGVSWVSWGTIAILEQAMELRGFPCN